MEINIVETEENNTLEEINDESERSSTYEIKIYDSKISLSEINPEIQNKTFHEIGYIPNPRNVNFREVKPPEATN